MNIGSIIARLVISFVHSNETYHYIGYTVAAGMLFISALLFIVGWRYYIHIKPSDSVVINCVPIIINAFQSRCYYKKIQRLTDKKNINSHTSNSRNTSQNLIVAEESRKIDEQRLTLLDFAKISNGGKFNDRLVDGVKSLRYAFIVLTLFIPYWIIDNQARSITIVFS